MDTHMLCSPVFVESDSRLPVSSPDAALFHPFSSSTELVNPIGRPPSVSGVLKVDRTNRLSPLESALTKNTRVTRLESALPYSLDLKSFRIRTYEKRRGRGANC